MILCYVNVVIVKLVYIYVCVHALVIFCVGFCLCVP